MPRPFWQPFLREIAASATYVENWQLAADAVDYHAAGAPGLAGPALLVALGRGAVLRPLAAADARGGAGWPPSRAAALDLAAPRRRCRSLAAATLTSLAWAIVRTGERPDAQLLLDAHARLGVRRRRTARALGGCACRGPRSPRAAGSWLGLARDRRRDAGDRRRRGGPRRAGARAGLRRAARDRLRHAGRAALARRALLRRARSSSSATSRTRRTSGTGRCSSRSRSSSGPAHGPVARASPSPRRCRSRGARSASSRTRCGARGFRPCARRAGRWRSPPSRARSSSPRRSPRWPTSAAEVRDARGVAERIAERRRPASAPQARDPLRPLLEPAAARRAVVPAPIAAAALPNAPCSAHDALGPDQRLRVRRARDAGQRRDRARRRQPRLALARRARRRWRGARAGTASP